MDLKRIEEIVKKNARGFEYEVFLLRKKTTKISTENGEVEKVSAAEDFGLGLRLKKGKKTGFAFAASADGDTLNGLVRELARLTLLLPEDPHARFCEKLKDPLAQAPFDGEGTKLTLEEKAKLVTDFEKGLMGSHPAIKGTRETAFSESIYEVFLKNSFGVEVNYKASAFFLVTSLIAESPSGDKNVSWGYRGSVKLRELFDGAFALELVKKTTEVLDPRPVESKKMRILIHRSAMAALLETFAPIFSGEEALLNRSPLAGKEGERVASDAISIFDDGTLKDGFATHPYDDEGAVQKNTPLIEEGVFKGFYHSLKSAAATGAEPTGNGFRASFSSPPEAAHSNLFIKKGKTPISEMLDGEVLIVYDFMGLHTADSVTGEFSLGVSGALYRDGRRAHGVRGVTVAGNFLELLASAEAVGDDLYFYGSVGAPSVLVKNITVGGE